MSIHSIDEALSYFAHLKPLLNLSSSVDIEDGILLASNSDRVRFARGMLDAIVGDANVPDLVALGGLRSIVDPAATMLPYSLFAEDVLESDRISVLRRMRAVFTDLFPRRCLPLIAHNASVPIPPWNSLCFMWWELLPRHGATSLVSLTEIDRALLDLMAELIEEHHIAVKESALHGLGHWHASWPDEVRSRIDDHAQAIPMVLRDYALAARWGGLG